MKCLIKRIFYVWCAVTFLWASPAPAESNSAQPVFILGIDGMDPQLLEKFVAKGRMPNFKKFMETGSYTPLGTSTPPQSPVAWANFITGTDPGSHGIFDFIHRDPEQYFPVFSASSVNPPQKVLKLRNWVIPLSRGEAINLRRGKAFWQVLDAHDIPYTIFRIPSNFPPVDCEGLSLSGMGTPDIIGTYGTFSFYTDDPSYVLMEDITGGEIYPISIENDKVTADLIGPQNTLRSDQPSLKRKFTLHLDRENASAKLVVGDEVTILNEGEWSSWVPVSFDLIGPLKRVHGICMFYLKSIAPYFQLYITPINIDPSEPALPIATPADYSKQIYQRIGYFYTQGMPEDTKALEAGVMTDGEFVRQTQIVLEERLKMLDTQLEDFHEGLLFFYISTIDQACHMLWKNMDPHHPAHPESGEYKDAIENLYAKMDSILGVVQGRIPENTTLIVMSDHGFAPFYKKFNLNTWLYQNGYLELRRPQEIGSYLALRNVFWRRTKAYALGINGLYVNLRGREAEGVVSRGNEYDALLDELSEKLLAVRDPETGEPVIAKVYKTQDIYHGEAQKDGPDLSIGYNRNYRSSDRSALGQLSQEVITLNMSKWSGDHCMAHEDVPGILLANKDIIIEDPDLKDLAVSILELYGIEKLPEMRGRMVFAP